MTVRTMLNKPQNKPTVPGTVQHRTRYGLCFIVLFCLLAPFLRAQDVRELWVPSDQLEAVLKKNPRAVFLTPEQYQSLLTDSQKSTLKAARKEIDPPIKGVVKSVSMTGRIQPGRKVVVITANYIVESLTDEWCLVPMVMPLEHLGQIKVDNQGALQVLDAKRPMLIIRGKGLHKVEAVFHLPVDRSATGESIKIHSPEVAVSQLQLSYPKSTQLNSALPFLDKNGKSTFSVPNQANGCWPISWKAQKVDPIPGAALFQTCSYIYTIDSSRLQADLALVLNSDLAEMPLEYLIDLPKLVRVLSVDGSELQSWNRGVNGQVKVKMLPGDRVATDLRLRVEVDIVADQNNGDSSVELPIAAVSGVHRSSGSYSLIGSNEVRVKQISTGPLTVPMPSTAKLASTPGHIASFEFPVQQTPPTVSFSRVQNRFHAQVDNAISIQREAIFFNRAVNIIADEGTIFRVTVEMPDGEEVESIQSEERKDFSWKQDVDTKIVSLNWAQGISPSSAARLVLKSRSDPQGWYKLGSEPLALQFSSLKIAESEKMSGYLAVDFNDSYKVETSVENGLEPRNGRKTPIKGKLAWFRLLDDYQLDLSVVRKQSKVEAEITSYALPLANTLEIEGQLQLKVKYSGIRELAVKAPISLAESIRFDSSLIAQQELDAQTGIWTLTFQKEQTGTIVIRYSISMALKVIEQKDGEGEKKFEIDLPKISILGADRTIGNWVLEANTDTELGFDTNGLDEIDSLKAPMVAGYKPRHRVLATYQYRGDDWSLKLSGTRHPHASMVTTVIDLLELDTVVSTDGTDRHEAMIALRSAGDQFLEIALPKDSVIWTLVVNNETTKPVRSGRDKLRVQLPANANTNVGVFISLIYETSNRGWRGKGRQRLTPIRLAQDIPVIKSEWRLHLPEGYDYQRFRSNMRADFKSVDRVLLGAALNQFQNRGQLKKAEDAAFRGSVCFADGDLNGAVEEYAKAVELLPRGQTTKPIRAAYTEKYAEVATALARQYADAARYGDSLALLDRVLSSNIAPNNVGAKQLLRQLNDPQYYSPALTPEHQQKIKQVRQFLIAGDALREQGNFEDAKKEFYRVLELDKYNTAARRSLEQLERDRISYFEVARDHARAKFLRKVEEGWEFPVPESPELGSGEFVDRMEERNEDMLKNIIIPSLEFEKTPLKVALDFLQRQSVSLDFNQNDINQKGINIIMDSSASGGDEALITMKLTNVPLGEAIRYTTGLANLKYKVEPHAVVVTGLSTVTSPFFTRSFKVPSDFLNKASNLGSGVNAPMDPFAPSGPQGPATRPSAKGILENMGISFPEGATAIFNPSSNTMVIRNTPEQLDLSRSLIREMGPVPQPKIGSITRLPSKGDDPIDSLAIAEMEQKLRNIIVPSLELEDTPLLSALQFLEQQSKELDFEGQYEVSQQGINISLDDVLWKAKVEGFGGFGDAKQASSSTEYLPSEVPVTLRLTNVPLGEALRYTTSLANLHYKVTADGVVIVPLSSVTGGFASGFDPFSNEKAAIVKQRYQVPKSIIVKILDGKSIPLRDAFEIVGITFPEGASADYDEDLEVLSFINSPDQIDLVEGYLSGLDGDRLIVDQEISISGGIGSEARDFLPGFEPEAERMFSSVSDIKRIGSLFDQSKTVIGNQKDSLSGVVLENLDFENKTLPEAITYLEDQLAAFSSDHSAGTSGIDIQIDKQTEPKVAEKKLNFSIAKATAIEVFDKITRESDTQYIMTRSGVVIADRSADIVPMETVYILLPPRVFQSIDKNGILKDHHARNVLRERGVKFPRGASAAYNSSTERLAVRNTKKNLEKVIKKLSRDMEAHAAAPDSPANDLRFSSAFIGGASDLKGFEYADIGRLPLDFQLPRSGRVYQFQGLYAPDDLAFTYVNWDRQVRIAWFWILIGFLLFVGGAWVLADMPLFLGVVIGIVLSLIPLLISSLTGFCNSLLIGWMVGFAFWLVYRLVRKLKPTETDWSLPKLPELAKAWRLFFTIVIGCMLIEQSAQAEEKKAAVKAHTVIVPYDADKPIVDQKASRYYLNYDTFQSMWKQVKEFRKPEDKSEKGETFSTISTSLYRLNSEPERLYGIGRLVLATVGQPWQKVPLKFGGVNISTITLNGKPASLVDGHVIVEQPGNHLLEIKFEIPFESGQQVAKWQVPKCSSVLIETKMDSSVAEPIFQNNWPIAQKGDVYTAALGQQTNIEFKRSLITTSGASRQPSSVTIDSKLFVAPGLELLESSYEINFPGREEKRFTIAFEDTFVPVSVGVPGLSIWEIRDGENNLREISFELTQPVRNSFTVDLIAERIVSDSKLQRTFPELTARASRIEQQRRLLRADGLNIQVQAGSNHRQIARSDASQSSGFNSVSAYSLNGKNEALNYTISKRSAKRSAVASYVYQVNAGKMETFVQFELRSPEAALLELAITLPEKAVIQTVQGNRIKDWWRTGDELFIRLSGTTPEVTAVLVYLSQEVSEESIAIKPLPLANFTGNEVSGEAMIAAHTTQQTNLSFVEKRSIVREVALTEVAKEFEVLPPIERKRGFKFDRAEFTGELVLSDLTPRFDGLWVMLAKVHESWVQLSVQVDIEVASSGKDGVRFQTKKSVPEFRVVGDVVREVRTTETDEVRSYEVIFQDYVTDATSFSLEAELPHNGSVSLPDISIVGGDRQERFLIVENVSAEQMSLKSAQTEPTVMSLLPYKPETLASAKIFRAQPRWSMQLTLEDLQTSAGNEAVILYSELTSAFRRSGEEWLKAVYHLQNRSLQFLPVSLPKDSDLVSVVVAGSEVRADRGKVDGQSVVLVPLIQTKPGQLAYDVELVFRKRSSGKMVGKNMVRQLDDPEVFGPTIEKTIWKVQLPHGYQLERYKGNMQAINETEGLLRKLQSDMSELQNLNSMTVQEGQRWDVQEISNYNAGLLSERIEGLLNSVNQNEQNEGIVVLKAELESQKGLVSRNKKKLRKGISIGSFGEGLIIDGGATNWLSNSGAIVNRDQVNATALKDQNATIQSQIRLNDNISLGNKYFNNIEVPKSDKKPKKQSFKKSKQESQVESLNQNPNLREVNEKLNTLNRVQLSEQKVINSEAGRSSVEPLKPQSQGGYGNARTRLNEIEDVISGLRFNQTDASDPFGGNNDPFDIAGGSVDPFEEPVDPFGSFDEAKTHSPSRFADQPKSQPILKIEGRRSVPVNFPADGETYYFQKLKDHATLKLWSTTPSDRKNLPIIAGLLALLGLTVVVKLVSMRLI